MWTPASHRLAPAAAVTLMLLLFGCGSDKVTPPPPPPTTLPPLLPQVVADGNGVALEAEVLGGDTFTTSRAGSLVATVDWTFATNDVDVALVRGDCSFEQFEAQQCPVLAFSISATAKPEIIRTDGAAAGTYTLFVENTGPTDESVSYQVVLTPSATGVSASRAPEGQGGFELKSRPRGYVEW